MCMPRLSLAKHCFRFYFRSPKGKMGRPKGSKNNNLKQRGPVAKPVIQKASNAAKLLAKCLKTGAEADTSEERNGIAVLPNTYVTPENPKMASGSKSWDKDLAALGYSTLTCQIPNKAVQAVLCCFGDSQVHEYIVCKELEVIDSRYSAVAYLGFNQWLALLAGYMKEPGAIFGLLDDAYNGMQELLFSRTEREDFFSAMAEKVNICLEAANNVSKSMASAVIIPKRNSCTPKLGNSIFKTALLERPLIGGNANHNAEPLQRKEVVRLNMANSSLFSALTNDLVEALARQYDHAMWRCKNLGVMAPISEESWEYLADIDKEQVKTVKDIMEAGDHILDKNLVDLPFGI